MNGQILRWLDTAVPGIRFKPDRLAVRRELEQHMEDKAAGLRRSFPDLSEEERYTLRLHRADGSLLPEKSGTLGER